MPPIGLEHAANRRKRHQVRKSPLDLPQLRQEQISAPQVQGWIFGRLDEPSNVFPGFRPVNRVDLVLEMGKAPFPIDPDILVTPRALLVQSRREERIVDSNILARVPQEIIPVPALDIFPAQQRMKLSREQAGPVLYGDRRDKREIHILPLEGPNAGWISEALEKAIRKYGAPKHIISDQASVFVGDVFAELLRQWDIKPRFGAVGNMGPSP
jgi:hypothetical protein